MIVELLVALLANLSQHRYEDVRGFGHIYYALRIKNPESLKGEGFEGPNSKPLLSRVTSLDSRVQ